MGQPMIQARTVAIGVNSTENIPGALDGPVSVVLRVSGADCYLGGADLNNTPSASNGYELNANQEYVFDLYPTARTGGTSADYQLTVWNNSGASVDLSYAVTAKEA